MAEIVYNQNQVFEVGIIGGGPAGLSAAYYCAKAGLDTIVLEEHHQIGKPVHCGEGLSAFAIKRMGLKDIPKEALGLKVKGIRIVFPDGTTTIYREEGYDLNKDIFEQYLAQRAVKEGASVKTSTRVVSVNRKNGLWSLYSPVSVVKTKVLIDATGYQSMTNQLLKINQTKLLLNAGAQYLIENVENDGFIEFYIDPKLAPEGYLWIMPKEGEKANVGLVCNEPKIVQKNLKIFLEKKGLSEKKIIRPFGGMIPCGGPLPKTYFDGLIMVGDAAGFTSPMFEGGTQLALKTGQLAAEAIIEAYNLGKEKKLSDPYEEENLKGYEIRWRKELPPYEKILKGKKYFYSFSEEELNKLGRILPADLTTMSIIDKIKILIRLFSISPNLIRKNFFEAMNTFSYSTGKNYGW
ncbi:MAG: NAD(P)/FAD-dependent oxidoreductase [Candidatus Anstonellaceae archaeon]